MGDYPDDLAERDYYDSLLGKGKGDPERIRWVGEDKATVQLTRIGNEPRDFGDNDKSDPFNQELEES